MLDLDRIDRAILEALQQDGRRSRADVAREVGLSTAAVHERIRKLERSGVIRRYAALLDPERAGYELLAFVEVFIEHPKFEAEFLEEIGRMPQIQECHHVTGAATCLLKVRAASRRALQRVILERINALPGVRGTESVVALSTTKETPHLQMAEGPRQQETEHETA